MQYEVKMNDWSVEISMESNDFELLSELQFVIESALSAYKNADEQDEDEEDERQEEFDFGDEPEDSQGTIIIINNK